MRSERKRKIRGSSSIIYKEARKIGGAKGAGKGEVASGAE